MDNDNKITDKELSGITDDLFSRMQHAKTEMCKESGMSDNPPLFLCVWESTDQDDEHESAIEHQERLSLEKPYKVGMIPLIHKSDVFDALLDVLTNMPIEKYSYLLTCVEGYMDTNPENDYSKESGKKYKQGNLEKDFQTNPFTSVKEALVVSGTNWETNKLFTAHCIYTYNDRGVPQFGDVITGEQDITESEILDKEVSFGRFCDAILGAGFAMRTALHAKIFHTHLMKKTIKKDESK